MGGFPDRFIYSHLIEEYGEYSQVPEYQNRAAKIRLDEKYEKELYYMTADAINEELKAGWRRKVKIFLAPSRWYKERKKIIVNSLGKYDSITDCCEHSIVRALTKWSQKRNFENNAKKYAKYDIDLQEKYVYFPLHLQPEMTTDTIGDIYRDQLLAIEKLRRLIPADWYIYVKENPKQAAMCRGKYFFKRLETIPNVVYVSRTFDTYELMKYSQFVATITGTAGYEAITGGKPVLVFGRAWYKRLPGVFTYSDNLRFEDIVKCKINHAAVEAGLNSILKKTGKGIWRQYDLTHVPNLDLHKNDMDLYDSFYFLFTKCL